MQWTRQVSALRKTTDPAADGEIVWSWPPDAEATFASCSMSAPVPGESAYKS